jgi:hypothetical protein
MPEKNAPQQTFANHAKFVPLYHFFLSLLILATLIGSCVNLSESFDDPSRHYNAALLVTVSIALLLLFWFSRTFALKAQDRAIRSEENLRHYVLTGKLIDPRVTIQQVIALRFAPDAEFPALVAKAAAEGTSPKEIKQSIQNWKADTYRV